MIIILLPTATMLLIWTLCGSIKRFSLMPSMLSAKNGEILATIGKSFFLAVISKWSYPYLTINSRTAVREVIRMNEILWDCVNRAYSKKELKLCCIGMATLYARQNDINAKYKSVYKFLVDRAVEMVFATKHPIFRNHDQEKMLKDAVLRVHDELDKTWKKYLEENPPKTVRKTI